MFPTWLTNSNTKGGQRNWTKGAFKSPSSLPFKQQFLRFASADATKKADDNCLLFSPRKKLRKSNGYGIDVAAWEEGGGGDPLLQMQCNQRFPLRPGLARSPPPSLHVLREHKTRASLSSRRPQCSRLCEGTREVSHTCPPPPSAALVSTCTGNGKHPTCSPTHEATSRRRRRRPDEVSFLSTGCWRGFRRCT